MAHIRAILGPNWGRVLRVRPKGYNPGILNCTGFVLIFMFRFV